jgi:hypothetical protein
MERQKTKAVSGIDTRTRTQIDDLKKELKEIEKLLQLHLMYNNLPKTFVKGLLNRAEIIRSTIFNID